jgi:hypothetical protein
MSVGALRAIALLVLAALSGSCSAKGFCAYPHTNPLAWDEQFISRIHQFFGAERLEYFYSKHTTSAQVLSGLVGPSDSLVRLGDGLVLASACRYHSCIEKAAVVIACPSTIVAVGIFHYDCFSKDSPANCTSKAHLTLYSTGDNETAHTALQSWGQSAADGYGLPLITHRREKSRTGLFAPSPRE